MGVTSTVSWLSVGLYGGGAMSDVVLISTGAPQLTVLSPFLFTFHCWEKKCSDDAAVGGCIIMAGIGVQGKNLLNVSKTKKSWLASRGELQVFT